jgi:hypothetical protein
MIRMEKMKKTKLIMLEGIPGSGKTTTSQLLYTYLKEVGVNSEVYIEGSEHPIDLPFYAYLTKSEYNKLLIRFPQQAEWIRLNSIIENDYILIPYKVPEPKPWSDELAEYLSFKELCYSNKAIVPFNIYKKVFYTRFEQYVTRMSNTDAVTIFESVLFQHQIHDINRLYPQIPEDEIMEYIRNLAVIISPLNPVLLYISQNSVEESLKHTAIIRSKPKWSNPETVEYYIKRKNLELRIVKLLPFRSYILNNTDRDWNKMFDSIKSILDCEIKDVMNSV